MEPEMGLVIIRLLQKPKAGDVVAYLSTTKGQALLESFTRQQLSDVMDNLAPDEQVAIMEELLGKLTQRVLCPLNPEDQILHVKLLGYPEECNGRLMNTGLGRM